MERKSRNGADGENLGRIREAIAAEKESARAGFRAAAFRARIVSSLGAGAGEPSRSARPFLFAPPLAAAAFGAAFIAVLAALWFFVLSPSPRPASATLHDHILEVLLQSSPRERPAAGPSKAAPAGASPATRVLPAPGPTPDREIPMIFFKVLESLIPDRPVPVSPALEEERASPTADSILFQEILRRIKEA
ncbi:MAG: hypothetical protein FJY83_09600 [Candidatus Aminicenantes bacterium]|nr:hypothetical protein [Candidatus Aminicenantes bacterium]